MTNEEIVGRIQQGGAGLMDRLLEQNRGFIYKVARRYLPLAHRNRGMDLEDLAQAACIGMIEAVPAWDAERGAFLKVAIYYMLNNIRQELGILTTKQRFENQQPPMLLSTPSGEEEGSDTMLDLIRDTAAADPQKAAELTDMQRIVRRAVKDLPDKQRDVVRTYYLDGWSMADLSGWMGCSIEKAEQIKRVGIKALRRNKQLRLLWMEYEAAAFTTRTYSAWKKHIPAPWRRGLYEGNCCERRWLASCITENSNEVAIRAFRFTSSVCSSRLRRHLQKHRALELLPEGIYQTFIRPNAGTCCLSYLAIASRLARASRFPRTTSI